MSDTHKPGWRATKKAANRQRIIETARHMITSIELSATTLRDVAAAASLSTGAIFANFRDKRELYQAAFNHDPINQEMAERVHRRAPQLMALLDRCDDHGLQGLINVAEKLAAAQTLEAA